MKQEWPQRVEFEPRFRGNERNERAAARGPSHDRGRVTHSRGDPAAPGEVAGPPGIPLQKEGFHPTPRLFEGLSPAQVNRVWDLGEMTRVNRGDVIFRQGEEDDTLYIVFDGEVNIALNRSPVAIGTVRSGDVLGEMSLLAGTPHSATAIAARDGQLVVLKRREIEALIHQDPRLGVQLMRNIARSLGCKLKATDQAMSRICRVM